MKGGMCVKIKEPEITDLYIMYNGKKHSISAADCVSKINTFECASMRCPNINFDGQYQ